MCYTVLLVEEHCPRDHELATSMCWRQCKAQAQRTALKPDSRRDWTSLCPGVRAKGVPVVIKSKYAVQLPVCHICLDLEADPHFQALRQSFARTEAAFEEVRLANQMHERNREQLIQQKRNSDLTYIQKNYVNKMIDHHDRGNFTSLIAQGRYKAKLDELQEEIDVLENQARTYNNDAVMDDTQRRVYVGGPADDDERGARAIYDDDFPEHFPNFDECDPESYPHRVLYNTDEA